jgi:hypothetical protein
MMWLTTLAVLKDESRSQIWSATMATSLYELAGWLGEGAEERCMISPLPWPAPSQSLENHGRKTVGLLSVWCAVTGHWLCHLVLKHLLWPVTNERWPWGRGGERGEEEKAVQFDMGRR